MADILTDPSATYAATAVLATKSNSTPRLPADSPQWVIAQWGNEVDSALKALSELLQGDSPAGTTLTTIELLGSLALAENFSAAGDTFALGANAQTSVDFTLLGTNTSTLRILLADPDSATAAGFAYDHSTNQLDVLIAASSRLQATSSKFSPTNHNVFDLGDVTHRFRQGHIGELFAAIGATIGTGSDVTVSINGSSTSNLEPKLDFQFGGTPVSRIQAKIDLEGNNLAMLTAGKIDMSNSTAIMVSRVTTADRTALTDDIGLLVFDTDLDQLFWNDGTGWYVTFTKNLEQTLEQGDTTGIQNIFVSDGTYIQFMNGSLGLLGESGGSISFDLSGVIQMTEIDVISANGIHTPLVHGFDFGVGSGAGGPIEAHGGLGGTTGGAGGAATIRGGHAQAGAGAGGILTLASGDSNGATNAPNILVTSGAGNAPGLLRLTNTCIEIVESASTPGPAIGAGAGRFWVRNTTPSRGYFTDDAGNEIDISGMPSVAGGVGNARLSTTTPATYGETGNGTPVLYFANGVIQRAHWWVQIPKSYVSTTSLTLRLWYSGTTASALGIQWNFNVVRHLDGDTMSVGDNSTATVPATAAGPAAIDQLKFADYTMSNAALDGVQAGGMIRLVISRDGTDAYAGSASLLGWQLIL